MCNNLSHQEKKTAKCLSTDSFTKQYWLLSGKQLTVNSGEALRKGKVLLELRISACGRCHGKGRFSKANKQKLQIDLQYQPATALQGLYLNRSLSYRKDTSQPC